MASARGIYLAKCILQGILRSANVAGNTPKFHELWNLHQLWSRDTLRTPNVPDDADNAAYTRCQQQPVCLFVCLTAHAPPNEWTRQLGTSVVRVCASTSVCVCACVWMKIVIRRVSLGNFFSCFDWFVIYCRCLRFAYSLFTLTISLLLLLAPLVLLLLRWVFDFDF